MGRLHHLSLVLGLALSFHAASCVAQRHEGNAPAAVRRWLATTRCRVHQPEQGPLDDRPPSPALVPGRFLGRAATDWAALCATQDSAYLLVFPGGRPSRVDTLETSVLPVAPTRRIYAGPSSEVRMYATSLPSEDLERADTIWMTHDGIVDAIDCCGVVWFWHGGRWRQLPGPD
jgi:hypothetical protein